MNPKMMMGYPDAHTQVPNDAKDRTEWMFQQPATLELTHNWGTESDPEFKVKYLLTNTREIGSDSDATCGVV